MTVLGVAYYPEQWPRERWAHDAALMAEAGLTLVRVGEFAWAQLEPEEGRFDFAWLDEALELLAGAGLSIVLGTPTAAPPAWLVERHPELLPVGADGRVVSFGHRRHYCPNRPAYREATARIVGALADRYGRDARIVAWQIDNELGGRCWCECCRAAFQDWLRARYGSLANLNESWGTAFWSQVYSSWEQVPLPDGQPVPADGFHAGAPNPGLALDFRRFASNSLVRYLRLQAEILRERCSPGQLITHNLMGFGFAELDYHALAAELDVVGWDNYPALDPAGRWSTPALSADAMRGLRQAPVWVLEQQVGPLGWELLLTPRRGQMRLHTYQAVGHGAEVVVFFRWRTPRFGTEQYWHGFLDADGVPRRRFRELTELARELERLRGSLTGATPLAEVALLHDYDSRFALQVQPTNPALAYEPTLQNHYEALRSLGLGVDVLAPGADLGRYRLVVAPNLFVVDPPVAAALAAYVRDGGVLVLAPRTGVKDRCNAVPERPLPAWLDELAGLRLVDYVAASDGIGARFEGPDLSGTLAGWLEHVELDGATARARFAEGELAGEAAVAEHAAGSGRTVYLAGAAGVETLRALYVALARDAGLETVQLPAEVELLRLANGSGVGLVLVLNHAGEPRTVELRSDWRDLVGERDGNGTLELGPFGVALLAPVAAPAGAEASGADR